MKAKMLFFSNQVVHNPAIPIVLLAASFSRACYILSRACQWFQNSSLIQCMLVLVLTEMLESFTVHCIMFFFCLLGWELKVVTSYDKISRQLSGDVLCRRCDLKLCFSSLFLNFRETRFKLTRKITRFSGRAGNLWHLRNTILIYFVCERTKS